MNSSPDLLTETAKDTANAPQNLLTMNGLFLLDLSTALDQAHESGFLSPTTAPNGDLIFQIRMCAEHRMAILPICPMCTDVS